MNNAVRVVLVTTILLLAGCGQIPPQNSTSGYDTPGGELSGSELSQSHLDQLNAVQNFSIVVVYNSSNSAGAITRYETDSKINETTGFSTLRVTSLRSGERATREVSTYTQKNQTYQRVSLQLDTDNTARYRSATSPYTDTEVRPVTETNIMRMDFIRLAITALDWERADTVTDSRLTTTQYNATGVQNSTALQRIVSQSENITAIRSRINISSDGMIVDFEFELVGSGAGTEVVVDLSLQINNINRTDVRRPPWVNSEFNSTEQSGPKRLISHVILFNTFKDG
jgi:hypothetical protein